MKNDKSIVDYYRARAAEYEQIYYREVPERRQEIAEHFDRVQQLATGKFVLELACGTGYWTQAAARSAREVVASDIADEMIKEARAKEFENRVQFVKSDLYQLPFQKSSFDLIIIGFWFSHEPKQNYQRFFEIILEPLKPKGLIWLIDNNPPAEGPRSDSTATDKFGNNFKRRELSNGEEFSIIKNYFTEKELTEIFSKAFEINELIHRRYYWTALLSRKQVETFLPDK
jgi:ubiquinone/menaquinone biosynthesis C-methylase UbiE